MVVAEESLMSIQGPEHYLRSLASHVPFYNPTPPAVAPHLRRLLNICKRRWIRDFLFNEDPTHLQIFSAPHYKQNAIACEISLARWQPQIIPNPYELAYKSSAVFIPAFSVDDISVGFGVDEKSYTCRNQSLTKPETPSEKLTSPVRRKQIEHFRYVRDDKRGNLIMVYDYESYFQVDYLSHQNTRTRQWSTSRFHRRALWGLLRSNPDIVDEVSLMRAMICIQFIDEFRDCPSCGGSPDVQCDCPLSLQTPRHSLDFSNHGGQMATHNGDFHGMVHLTKYSKGNQVCLLTLGNLINIRTTVAPDLVNRLTDYILSRDLPKWPYELAAVSTSNPFQRLGTEAIPSSSFLSLQGPVTQGLEQGSTLLMPTLDDAAVISCAMRNVTAPLLGSSESRRGTPNVPLTAEEIDAQREKEQKLERKKERNRASAHRSNMRKKAENEQRKENLFIMRQLEAELRAKERSLREENLRLRELLYGNVNPHR